MRPARPGRRRVVRRGAFTVLAAVLLAVVLILSAFMLNVGLISLTAGEAQACADATSVSAAGELLSRRTSGQNLSAADRASLKAYAQDLGQRNPVFNVKPSLDTSGDITFGIFTRDGGFAADDNSPTPNAVRVRVRRTADKNGALPLFLGSLLGRNTIDVERTAVAGFAERITGFRPRSGGPNGNSTLIPFTIRVDDWTQTLAGTGIDLWSYDSKAKAVGLGADGLSEYLMYSANSGPGHGNHGILSFGGSNSMPALRTQVSNGVSAADLAAYGGELKLGPDGTVNVDGRPGWPDPVYRAAQALVGKPVSIPLYKSSSGNGGQAVYSIVGFAGARIVEVSRHGGGAYIRIQPAVVLDDTAIEGSERVSYGIVRPVTLVQ